MIKKFIRKILGVKDERNPTEPVILGPEEHQIDPKNVSANAVRVTQTLTVEADAVPAGVVVDSLPDPGESSA